MLDSLARKLYKVPLYNNKLPEFWYSGNYHYFKKNCK